MTLAWTTAALTRGTKGLPKLERLLAKRTGSTQSVPQQRAALQLIFGQGRAREHPRG